MIKLTLLVFLFTIIATGYLQEVSNSLQEPSSSDDIAGTTKQLWLQQFQGLRRNGKPCRRRNNNNGDGQLIPSYSSRISHPLYESTVLQPQALKNEEYRDSAATPATENYPTLTSSRRSPTDDDCADQLDTVSTDPNAEKTALKIIEDCLKKKQNNQNALGSSRRSLSDPDSINNDNNNYPRDSEIDELMDDNKLDDIEDVNRRAGTSKKSSPEDSTDLASRGKSLNKLRICYACSTAADPSCWEPDKRTTIKYCRTEQSCVTKTFGVKNHVTLIRDCANSCTDTSVPGLEPKYKSCKICHSDYCNSAMANAINVYNLAIILIISIVKCTY